MKYWQNKKGTVGMDLDQVIGFRCVLDGHDNSLNQIYLYCSYNASICFYKSDNIGDLHILLKKKFESNVTQ